MKKNLPQSAIIFISALLLLLASCGKYEEGPNISFRSKKARIANDWVLDEMYINGELQNLSAESRSIIYSLTKDGKIKTQVSFLGQLLEATGNWEFYDNKEELKTSITYTFLISYTDVKIFKILRLKEKELWLERTEQNGNKVEYRYVSK